LIRALYDFLKVCGAVAVTRLRRSIYCNWLAQQPQEYNPLIKKKAKRLAQIYLGREAKLFGKLHATYAGKTYDTSCMPAARCMTACLV